MALGELPGDQVEKETQLSWTRMCGASAPYVQ